MAGVIAANGALVDHGLGAIHWQILWQEVRILGLGEMDGMELSRRDRHIESEDIQGGGGHRGSGFIIIIGHSFTLYTASALRVFLI